MIYLRPVVLLGALVLDLLLGDPDFFVHPVILMGKGISRLEQMWNDRRYESGRRLALCMIFSVTVLSVLVVFLAYVLHPFLGLGIEMFLAYQCLAVRDMLKESRGVECALGEAEQQEIKDIRRDDRTEGTDLIPARRQIARIVGRDTGELSYTGIIMADIETVAENFSDGVGAPLFYLWLLGAPGALVYKTINTMDSMIAYKNERYMEFGRFAAHVDDVANFLPARISSMILWMAGGFKKTALSVYHRDKNKSQSPNSAHTESMMAGLLQVRLGGPLSYFGKTVEKPYLGEEFSPPERSDIRKCEGIFLRGAVIMTVIFAVVFAGLLL